jgi:hypothetical protein
MTRTAWAGLVEGRQEQLRQFLRWAAAREAGTRKALFRLEKLLHVLQRVFDLTLVTALDVEAVEGSSQEASGKVVVDVDLDASAVWLGTTC